MRPDKLGSLHMVGTSYDAGWQLAPMGWLPGKKSPIKETISGKKTYHFKEPTNRSHPIVGWNTWIGPFWQMNSYFGTTIYFFYKSLYIIGTLYAVPTIAHWYFEYTWIGLYGWHHLATFSLSLSLSHTHTHTRTRDRAVDVRKGWTCASIQCLKG